MQKINFQNLPSTTTPINATNLNAIQTNAESAINDVASDLNDYVDGTTSMGNIKATGLSINNAPIIDSGSNSNGSYVKYSDGTMICYKSHQITTSMTSSWGGWYESGTQNLGSFPVNFIAKPIIQATVSYGTASIESILNTSTTSWGSTILYRPVSTSSYTYYVDLIAIGKWK